MKAKTKQWFIDRIGKVVFSDTQDFNPNGVSYIDGKGELINGETVKDKDHALLLFEIQDNLIRADIDPNYRDEK